MKCEFHPVRPLQLFAVLRAWINFFSKNDDFSITLMTPSNLGLSPDSNTIVLVWDVNRCDADCGFLTVR
jgi:hypothetical protein